MPWFSKCTFCACPVDRPSIFSCDLDFYHAPLNFDPCAIFSIELKTLLTRFYTLSIIFHFGEDFSNLSRTQHSIKSTPTGCTNVIAYVPPAQGIKPCVVHANELHQAQVTGRIWVAPCNVQISLPEQLFKHIGGILLCVIFCNSMSSSSGSPEQSETDVNMLRSCMLYMVLCQIDNIHIIITDLQ